MRDYGAEAQKAAEAHLAACTEAMFAWEEGDDLAESPACAPFCGCDTCVVREVLHAAWPFLLLAAEEELTDGVRAEQEDQPESGGDESEHDVLEGEVHDDVPPSSR